MTEPTPRPLASKLAEVMGEMRHIPKEGFNRSQNYKFVRETDVAEKASQLLSERGIWVEQTVVSSRRRPLYQTQSGMTMWITKVVMEFRFVDGETGEASAPRSFPGEGADTGDKGIYKAMTGAEKYFLLKSFFVSTGDDPEADEKVDREEAAAGAARGPVRVQRGSQDGVQRGGRSTKATAAQINEVARLAATTNLTPDGIVSLAGRITGLEVPEGTTPRAFLASMTGAQVASVIDALSVGETHDEPAVVEDENPVETVEKEANIGATSGTEPLPEGQPIA